MKNKYYLLLIVFVFCNLITGAQGIHFSQYFNSPMLTDPSNTGLLLNSDWRVGAQFRNQWSLVPVPYNTFSAFGDFAISKEENTNGWGGIGISFWNDKAGDGGLSLNKIQLNGAYHIHVGNNGLFNFGMAVASCSRTVDLSKLTFDSQWDDAQYNPTLPSKENIQLGRSKYVDMQLGLSYVQSTDERMFKASISAQHINRPNETFLGQENRLGIRPIIHVEGQFKTSSNIIFAPSAYYTTQKKASELIFGTMSYINMAGKYSMGNDGTGSQLLLGAYYRYGDALIFATGFKYNNKCITLNYDLTVSDFAAANNSFGALELSLIVEGNKYSSRTSTRGMGCPRF